MEQLKLQAGIDLLHVPFRGSAPAVIGLLSGTIDVLIDSLTNTKSNTEDGKLRLVAVGTPERLKSFPNVTAIAEALPGFDARTWVGIAAPPATPNEIIDKLNGLMRQAFARPEVLKKLAAVDLTPVAGAPDEMKGRIKALDERWSAVIKLILAK
jgi:tripartite-type tricarboxylate transporter receptor subunit TctC